MSLILVLNPVIVFTIRGYIKSLNWPKYFSKLMKSFIEGIISKLIATIITYPLTTIKILQQTNSKNISILKLVNNIFKVNGYKGFYKGLNEKIFSSVLQAGLLLLFYDQLNIYFNYLFKFK